MQKLSVKGAVLAALLVSTPVAAHAEVSEEELARNASRIALLTRIARGICVTGNWRGSTPFAGREGPGARQEGKDSRNFVPEACRAILFGKKGEGEYVFTLETKQRLLTIDWMGGVRCAGEQSVLLFFPKGSILGAVCKDDRTRVLKGGEFDYRIRTDAERRRWEDELDRMLKEIEPHFKEAPPRT